MTVISRTEVLDRLKQVNAPGSSDNIVALGFVSEIFISEGKVFFSISVPAERAEEFESVRQAAEKAVITVKGVKTVIVSLTAERKGAEKPVKAASFVNRDRRVRLGPALQVPLAGVEHIIAVASGKGGVGKSTTAINLALALKESGLATGLLDADIYGPSLPRLTAMYEKPESIEKKLYPLERYGLKLMSIGFLVEEETPVVWRGPMVMSAVTQMLRDVLWAPLDVLVVDMPPGTGDAQLTLAQQVPLSGSIIVSTPQDLALVDARKAIAMFTKVHVPVLGIIENMSYFLAPDTGRRYDIFGHGGARNEAEKRGITFLGEVPLDPQIRSASDKGEPVIIAEPDGKHARLYRGMAQLIIKNCFYPEPAL